MSGRPVSLRGHQHVCPIHGGGPVVRTQTLVAVDGVLVATVSDTCICAGGGVDPISGGSSLVSIDGKPVARIGDATSHGGKLAQGVSWVSSE